MTPERLAELRELYATSSRPILPGEYDTLYIDDTSTARWKLYEAIPEMLRAIVAVPAEPVLDDFDDDPTTPVPY